MKQIIATAALCGAAFLGGYSLRPLTAQAQDGPPAPVVKVAHVSLERLNEQKEIPYPWGSLRWLMSSTLDKGAEQTFGVVQIKAGQKNFLHSHPNCEELLYVISGSCEHIVGDKKVTLHPHDLVRVPRGVPHQAIVTGSEPLLAVISYSSPDRQVTNYGEHKE